MRTQWLSAALLCVLAISITFPFHPVYAAESNWSLVLGPHTLLQDVIYGNDLYVAIGSSGSIFSSPDGKNWTVEHQDSKDWLYYNRIAWNGKIFVVVGAGNFILSSPDGKVWSEQKISDKVLDNISLNDVIWGGDQFVAVGRNGLILTSPDGTNWTNQDSGSSTAGLHNIVWADNSYIAFGNESILVSQDGQNWAEHSDSFELYFPSVQWCNNHFIAVGNGPLGVGRGIYISKDGFSWDLVESDISLTDVVWTGSKYYAVGHEGKIYVSTEGVNWLEVNSGTDEHLFSIGWGAEQLIAVGDGIILTSHDGSHWSPSMDGTIRVLHGVIWEEDKFFAFGEAGFFSQDGLDWTVTRWGTNSVGFRGAAYGADKLVAVGWDQWDQVVNDSYIFVYNGEKWSETTEPVPFLSDIVWFNDSFVTVGDSIYTSPDGESWSEVFPGAFLRGLTQGNGILVAVGLRGKIFTSPDGKTWTVINAGVGDDLFDVTWGDGLFVAVGENGCIISSPDGENWTRQQDIPVEKLNAITRSNNLFVAVGDSGMIVTSHDGVNWETSPSATTWQLSGVAWGLDSFIVTTEFGSLLYAPESALIASSQLDPTDELDSAELDTADDNPNSLILPLIVFGSIAVLLILLGGIIYRKKSI